MQNRMINENIGPRVRSSVALCFIDFAFSIKQWMPGGIFFEKKIPPRPPFKRKPLCRIRRPEGAADAAGTGECRDVGSVL